MLFRFLFLFFLIYWAYKLIVSLFPSKKSDIEVNGKSSNEPLDLSDSDVEDVDYKEIKD